MRETFFQIIILQRLWVLIRSNLSRSLKSSEMAQFEREYNNFFLLAFHLTTAVLYRFQDLVRYWPKIADFPNPPFRSPFTVLVLEFYYAAQKQLEWWGYWAEKSLMIPLAVSIQYTSVTDGENGNRMMATALASCGKNLG